MSPFKTHTRVIRFPDSTPPPYQTLLKVDSVTLKMTHRAIVVEVFLSGHGGLEMPKAESHRTRESTTVFEI